MTEPNLSPGERLLERLTRFSLPGSTERLQVGLLGLFGVLGLIACVAIPLGAGFDEEQHLRRAWEMAHLHLVPNSELGPDLPIPAYIHDYSYRQQPIVRPVSGDLRSEMAGARLDVRGWIYDDAQTRSIYSPVLLLPQSFALRYAALKYAWPGLQVLWIARVAGFAAYLLLAYLAVRFVPYGKWVLLVLALSPTALFQAATVSADTLTNGIGLLFIAGVLAAAEKPKISGLHVAAVLGLVALLFHAKINMVPLALLPLALLWPDEGRGWRNYLILLLGTGLLFGVEVVGWNALAYPAPGESVTGSNAFGQLGFIAQHPFWYAQGLVADLAQHGPAYLRGWAAAYGYYYWPVPGLVYLGYGLAIVAALAFPGTGSGPSRRGRLVMVAVAIVTYTATAVSLQLTAEPVGSLQIHELHGRYFTPVLPLVFLALLKPPEWGSFELPSWLPAAAVGASLTLFVAGLGLVYYRSCGSAFYRLGTCYQPQYKNWAPGGSFSQPVSEARPFRQEFVAECDGLSQVRVWVDASAAEPAGVTRFEVGDEATGRSLVVVRLPNDRLPEQDWVYMEYEPVENSMGGTFWVEVSSAGPAGATGPRLGMTIRPEYERGLLLQGGEDSRRDLFFQYGCVLGLERLRRQVLP